MVGGADCVVYSVRRLLLLPLLLAVVLPPSLPGAVGQETRQTASSNPTPAPPLLEQKDVQTPTDSRPMTERTAGASQPGDWGRWSSWSVCSTTCGVGQRRRSRTCERGVCRTGDTTETRACNIRHCEATSSSAGQWTDWSACSVSCGGGTSRRRRCRTTRCDDYDEEMRNCNTEICPRRQTSRGWAEWTSWGGCNRDCISYRRRNCQDGLNRCGNSATGRRRCSDPPCQSSWSTWTQWSACSVTCAGRSGRSRRTRSCPSSARCSGSGTEEKTCRVQSPPCPSAATWGSWSTWSTCEGACGSGERSRVRPCLGSASGGGCIGNTVEREACEVENCRGTFGPWKAWGRCSKTCGGGTRQRERTCSGGQCSGANLETGRCNTAPCPGAGTFLPWAQWSQCSVTCGYGHSRRQRRCMPSTTCSGRTTESRSCNSGACDEGPWQQWGYWSQCSVSCGRGNSFRTRDCSQGLCHGHTRELRDCKQLQCESDPWTTWSPWNPCSISCGWGNTIRERACLGDYCHGSLREARACADQACPGQTLATTEPPTSSSSAAGLGLNSIGTADSLVKDTVGRTRSPASAPGYSLALVFIAVVAGMVLL